jgi:hypothetical protein
VCGAVCGYLGRRSRVGRVVSGPQVPCGPCGIWAAGPVGRVVSGPQVPWAVWGGIHSGPRGDGPRHPKTNSSSSSGALHHTAPDLHTGHPRRVKLPLCAAFRRASARRSPQQTRDTRPHFPRARENPTLRILRCTPARRAAARPPCRPATRAAVRTACTRGARRCRRRPRRECGWAALPLPRLEWAAAEAQASIPLATRCPTLTTTTASCRRRARPSAATAGAPGVPASASASSPLPRCLPRAPLRPASSWPLRCRR